MEDNSTEWCDDRFVNGGLWYDGMAGDFCQFERGDGVIEMLNPETGEVYHEFGEDEWLDEQADFTRVPQEAIEDPEGFMEEFLADALAQARDWPIKQYAALMFAKENTTVRATDDRSYNL